MSRRTAPTSATVNLLWALSAGHCELCGSDVTNALASGTQGKYGQVAHIEAYSPGGARYSADQTEEERNSIDNLMLLCPACHKLIDDNAPDFGVEFLKDRKQFFEASVKAAVSAIEPACSDVLILGMRIGGKDFQLSEKGWKRALVDAGVNVGDRQPFDASRDVPEGCGPETLRSLRRRIDIYRELIHGDGSRRTSVFAIAPQPVLIGLGTMLADDGNVDVYQKRRDAEGWSWASDGRPNSFSLEAVSSGGSEGCAIVVSVSGPIDRETYADALSDSVETVYELRASRTGPTAIRLRDDWYEFKRTVTSAVFEIHERHPEVRSLHVLPAMPVSACVAFGMAWNERLIPELVIYEKHESVFSRTLSIGGPDGFAD
ncbi:SAVED domain-containing protein [Olsenella uli]|uniref:SAVED domain-containing protein n=1 Tax=Olsenella uli TaxID=133926 RepID=UPI001956D81E|nr:SAVED domain-containing protein [Olsenella uli]MBM6816684.1 SAVED domain-containing protein [Olsenella uli]